MHVKRVRFVFVNVRSIPRFGGSSANREIEHRRPQQPERRGYVCDDAKDLGPDGGESARRTEKEDSGASERDSNRPGQSAAGGPAVRPDHGVRSVVVRTDDTDFYRIGVALGGEVPEVLVRIAGRIPRNRASAARIVSTTGSTKVGPTLLASPVSCTAPVPGLSVGPTGTAPKASGRSSRGSGRRPAKRGWRRPRRCRRGVVAEFRDGVDERPVSVAGAGSDHAWGVL